MFVMLIANPPPSKSVSLRTVIMFSTLKLYIETPMVLIQCIPTDRASLAVKIPNHYITTIAWLFVIHV